MDITYHVRQNTVIVDKEIYIGCYVGTPDKHLGIVSDIFGEKVIVMITLEDEEKPFTYIKNELKFLNIRISLFGQISLPKKLNPRGQKLEITLLDEIFQKSINGKPFYHEIPSICLKEKKKVMYYSKFEEINSEIEEYLADLYDETIYDFVNISDYVTQNIINPMMSSL